MHDFAKPLAGVAVVTGAGSGIGRAIAMALAAQGATVCAVGRTLARLRETVELIKPPAPPPTIFEADLTLDRDIDRLATALQKAEAVNLLVHSAGVIRQARMQDADPADFDLQFRCNVRAPYFLTKAMLPSLKAAKGQVVFINSSAGVSAPRAEVGLYAATKRALTAVADSLREEVNANGVRVLSVYAGRTATPMQEEVCRHEGLTYQPNLLLQPEDVAAAVVSALTLPRTAELTDIHVRPMFKRPFSAT